MSFEIEIAEGHDPSSCFWFRPVLVEKDSKIMWEDITVLEEVFSIEEGIVECFLDYFIRKYFDEMLIYNRERFESGEGYVRRFEWYLTHNFYTYASLEKMCEEILEIAELLDTDYDDVRLNCVKKNFSIFYMCDEDDADYQNGDNFKEAIKKHIDVVIDFYRRFVNRLRRMMKNNTTTELLSIMGP